VCDEVFKLQIDEAFQSQIAVNALLQLQEAAASGLLAWLNAPASGSAAGKGQGAAFKLESMESIVWTLPGLRKRRRSQDASLSMESRSRPDRSLWSPAYEARPPCSS
jgi:hypothetical protein